MKRNSSVNSSVNSVHANVLTDAQCREIYHAALRILEQTGCHIESPKARDLLNRAGCKSEHNLVKIPGWLVEKCLRTVPRQVTIYNQEKEAAAVLDAKSGNAYFCPGVSNIYRFDVDTGERRKAVRKDAFASGAVVDALENFDFACGLAYVSDCTQELANAYEVYELLRATKKPLWVGSGNLEDQKTVFQLCAEAAGGMDAFREKPFVIACAASTSPLTHTKDNLDIILYTYEMGIPVVYLAAPMLAATAPATLAGTLAVGLADNLVGLVLSQLSKEGAPFIGCCLVDMMDVKTMAFSHTAPEFTLGSMASCDLFKYLDIPFMSHFGSTDCPVFDQQSAFDLSTQIYSAMLMGCNFNFFSGFLETCMNGSLEMLIFADEIIGYLNRIIGGVKVDTETLAEMVVSEVGPGGSFLGEEHTIEHYQEYWNPSLFIRENYNTWTGKGAVSLSKRANERVKEILRNHQSGRLSEAMEKKLLDILETAENHIRIQKG